MKHFQTVVNGFIPCDTINIESVNSKQNATRQVCEICQCQLPQTRQRLDYTKWSTQQNLPLQRQPPSH